MPEEENVIAQGERSIAVGGQATDNNIYSGDDLSIKIERDAISSAIISGNGNKVVIYQYQLERQVLSEKTSYSGEIGPNPYKGLLAFQSEDGDRYFGREAQIEKLWNLFRALHENITQPEAPLRLLPILGPSGSGKSSLARAGLIPELARRSLPSKSQARVAVLVPGTHPVEALATVLARVATNDQTPVAKTREFTEELKQTSNTTTDTIIYDGLRRIANVLPEITISPLVVLVDQFEEVYSLCKDTTERQIFIENLIHAASDRSGCVSVIITLRSDFLGETQRHPALNQVIASEGVIVPAMSEEELRRAITKPALLAGHPLDEAVVSLLLKDTHGREGALPLLQFALTRIWEGLKKGVEPIKTLEEIRGVGGALALEAQRIFDNLNESEKKIARRVFLGLVQLGEGASDTRRRANVNSLVSYKDKPEYVKGVIDRFASPGVRLITLSSLDGKETAEVTHEALFANWDQMKEWLDSSRSDIRFQRRLDETARVWDENGRPEGSLWRSPDLDLLRKFYQQKSDNMTPLQVEFFNASVNAEEALKKAAIKAEQEQKRQRQVLIGVLSIGLLLTTTTAGFAAYQWKQAETQQIQALLQSSEANLNSSQELGLDARVASLAAGKILKHSWWQAILLDIGLKNQVLGELSQTIYNAGWELNRFEGNQGSVKSVVFSPDSKLFATCGTDNTVRLWDISGKQLAVINGGNSVVFSSDSKLLATTGFDGTGRLWNTSGKQLAVINRVNSVAFSPDGKLFATSGADRTARLWDTSGKQLAVLKNDQDLLTTVVFSPDSKLLAISGSYRNTPLWNTTSLWDTSGKQLAVLNGGNNVVFSSDGKLLATSGNNGTTSLWDTSGKLLTVLNGAGGGSPKSVAFSPDGELLATCGNGTAVLWYTSGQLLTVLNGAGGRVNSVAFSPDGKLLATGGDDRTARLWDTSYTSGMLGEQSAVFKGGLGAVTSVAFSPDGKLFATSGDDRTAHLWNISGKQSAYRLKGHQREIRSVVFSPDGKLLATTGFDGTGRLWDTSGKQLAVLKGHQGRVYDVVFSPDGKLLATSGDDDTARLWNISGKQLAVFARFPFGGGSIVFSPDSKLFVASDIRDGYTARLWDISGKQLAVLKDDQGAVNSAAFSPDGKLLATGGQDGTAHLWDTSGQLLAVLKSDQGWVKRVAFSPDGKLLATGGQDGTVRLWDTSGKQLVVLKYHQVSVNRQASVDSLVFSPDGKLLATPGKFGTVLWQVGGLDELLAVSCDWVSGYVQTNPNVSDHTLCNDVATQK